MSRHYDVAIIGGGMVGASLALALASADAALRIALFEAYPLPPADAPEPQPSYDARATALAYGTREIFEGIGVWPALAEQVAAIQHIQVSDRGHFGVSRLHAAEQGVPALGFVVENRRLGQTLMARLRACPAVALFCPAEVISARAGSEGMTLAIDIDGSAEEFSADLVVMADGGRSKLRDQLGIDYHVEDYQQCALIANLTPSRAHDGWAYERFTDDGPMALLPMIDDAEGRPRAALVWSVPLEAADEMLAWDDDRFLDRLQTRFGYRAGLFERVGERHSYPLKLARVREQHRRGLALLGNAAHSLHPIAGQGFNLALRGALALAEEVVQAVADGRSPGSLETLERFQRRLGWDQTKTIGFSDRATRLFSNGRPPLVLARNLGLLALDLLPPAKHAFAASAMGLDVPLPHFGGGR